VVPLLKSFVEVWPSVFPRDGEGINRSQPWFATSSIWGYFVFFRLTERSVSFSRRDAEGGRGERAAAAALRVCSSLEVAEHSVAGCSCVLPGPQCGTNALTSTSSDERKLVCAVQRRSLRQTLETKPPSRALPPKPSH